MVWSESLCLFPMCKDAGWVPSPACRNCEEILGSVSRPASITVQKAGSSAGNDNPEQN